MTAEDQENCTFEPKIGTLNENYKPPRNGGENDKPSATFYERFGENFKKDGQTRYLYKLGILR